jgi:integrase
MYILSAWTGYRRKEIGSLTKRSFRLDSDPPLVIVAPAYSKRRRQDAQVLHPEVANRLRRWLDAKRDLGPDDLLFPISGSVPGGTQRRTAKMMQRDLERARKTWIEEAQDAAEKKRREESDFLVYRDSAGRFADFHSHRHTFITALERAGVRPRTAQTLAWHSDIRLTMGIYTHIGLHDQTRAIESLPPPPETNGGEGKTDAA